MRCAERVTQSAFSGERKTTRRRNHERLKNARSASLLDVDQFHNEMEV